jgi:TP901 family phage tail tape measure protein
MMAGNYSLGVAQGAIIISYDGKGVAQARAGLRGVKAESKAAGVSAAAVGKSMTKTGLIMAAGLGVAVKQAVDFQQKMNLLVTAAGESPKAIGQVAKGLQDIAIQTGTSLDQMADGMYLAEKAGFRAANGLLVMRAAAQGARAENVDLATFTNALTSVMTSYSYKADQATNVTNMLVRAAGASKTTMQEFAGALATVLPVASALGISFPQVAGAMSVLTQHGTSAREATQELANLIRNLAGQNNVAKASLEQLGVPVVDLQKNLGRRGLTGTLAIVTRALRAHGHAGMIVTDALKHSATATQAMNTMVSKMPSHLAKASKEFANGAMSAKEYRQTFKDLGGPATAMGQQFMGLFLQSKGFSNALKSGNPRVATLASTLQKALGGATGLRTALQLGVATNKEASSSAKLLAANTKDIGDAGKKGGKDIETWAKTSETAAVKLGRLKAAGEVFGVVMGNIVLPAVTTVVGALTKFLGWLTDLPGPVKHMIGYGTLLAASFLLLGGLLIKLVEFGRRFYGSLMTMGRGVGRLMSGLQGLLVKLGILPSAEAKAAAAAEEASAAEVRAREAVNVAYQEGVAAVEAAEEQLAAAYAAAAEAANASAVEQENAALRVQYAQEGLAVSVQRAEAAIAIAEEEAAAAAQRAALTTEEAMAAQTRAVQAGAAAQEEALAGLSAANAGAGAAGAGRAGAMGAGGRMGGRFSGGGMLLGGIGFMAGEGIKDGQGGARDNAGTVVQYAGAGAMLGAFAGPQGAAIGAGIGAVVGGLKDIWDWSHKDTAASKEWAAQAKADAAEAQSAQETYNGALQQTGGLIDKNMRALVSQRLAQQGILDLTDKAGANRYDVTSSVLGNAKASDRVITALDKAVKLGHITVAEHDKIERSMGIENEALLRQNRLRQQANDATSKNWDLHKSVGKQIKENGKTLSLSYDTPELQALMKRVHDSGNKPGPEQRKALAYNTTDLLSSQSVGAQNNEKFITDHIKHLQDLASQQLKTGKTGQQAATWYNEQANALQRTLIKAGYAKDAVKLFFGIMSHPPKPVQAKLDVETKAARQKVWDIQQRIRRIKQGKVPGLTAHNEAGKAKIAELQGRIDRLHQKYGVPLHVNTDPAKADMDSFSSWFSGYISTISSNAVITPHVAKPTNLPPMLVGAGSDSSSGGRSSGGWIPGPSTRRWKGVVHGREYVLSTDMLSGRRPVDPRVLASLSHGQRVAMATRQGSIPLSALTPASAMPSAGGGASGPRRHSIVSGELEISRGSMGELRAHVQDMIAEEHDFHTSLAGMG